MGAVRQCGWAADCTRPTSKAATWPGRSSAGVNPAEARRRSRRYRYPGGHDDRDRGHGVAVIRPCVKRPSHPPLVGQAVLQLPTGRGERGTPGEFGIRRKNAVFSAEAKRGQNAKIRPAFLLNETRCSSIVFGRQSSGGKTQSFRRMTVSRRVHDYYSAVRFWGRVEQVGS